MICITFVHACKMPMSNAINLGAIQINCIITLSSQMQVIKCKLNFMRNSTLKTTFINEYDLLKKRCWHSGVKPVFLFIIHIQLEYKI